MKRFIILSLISILSLDAFAQFPGGPPPGGSGGDGMGRQRNNNNSQQNLQEDNTPKGNSKITGYVIDEAATTAVEYATISLISKATNKPVDGTMADDKGKFSLTRVAPGDYKLQISFIGFEDKIVDNIKVEKSKDIDLGTIKMKQAAKLLNEITVTAQAALVEEKVDRLVYNAEKDLTSKGGDAADVLRKVPMLTVDLDGNVSLRGTSNIRVLINNKPSTIVASSVADALKMLPADMIKSVEVITSPSAKYDAEGSGGIINIITKKVTLQGLTLNLDTGAGLRGSNLGLNGNYRQGKLGVSLGGFGRLIYNKSGGTLEQSTNGTSNNFLTRQTSTGFDNGMFGRYNLGFDYDLGKNQSLSAGVAFGVRNMNRDQDFTTQLFSGNSLSSTAFRTVDSKDLSNSVDMNLDYLRTFKPSQEWSISTQYSQNNLTNNFDANILNNANELLSRSRNLNANFNKELTVQSDFTSPIGKTQSIEFGVKGIFRQVDSDFRYLSAGATGDYFPTPNNPSGILNYSQNIASGYLSYTFSTKNKYIFKLGSRYEYTNISANDLENEILIPSYGNLVPSVNISKKISKSSTLKLGYNKRIQRPGLQQLNPNFNAANPQNINMGNPNLKPEITDNVELGLSTNLGKTYLNLSVFGRQSNNAITRITMPSDTLEGAVITTFQNIGQQRSAGSNIFANVFLTQKWTLNGGIDLLYTYLEGQTQNTDGTYKMTSNSGFVIGGRLQTQLQLPNNWAFQAFGGFRGNQVQLQGMQGSFYMYSVALRKDFKNKKGSVGLAADNFFGGMNIKTTLNSALFNQVNMMNIYNQNVRVTFSYKIGKMSFVQKKTKSVKNDDVMSSSEN